MEASVETGTIETRIPARLDRLPWSKFHWLIVVGLGTVWILDGLEVTIVGSIASRLTEGGSGIELDAGQIGTAAAFYVAGACVGALFFGQLTDRFGRKKLFLVTLAVYISATIATAFAFAPWYFFAARFFTGAGIGGEYAAINSAIDELIPARVRGRVDLIINGSYWFGAAGGALAAVFFLDTSIFATDFGWRLAFGVGAVLGLAILLVRRHVPESPRWLFIHGREEEAEEIVDSIEADVREETGQELEEPEQSIKVRQRERIPFREIAKTAFKAYPQRTTLGLALFVGQAFLYNAITFDLGTLLSTYFGIGSGTVPLYIALWAFANFLGPLTLGRLFDTVGRKPMISGTYLGSGALAVVIGLLMMSGSGDAGSLTTWSFMALLIATFFIASAGASSAYLTVSEIFPMETRALAIAFFYAVGTAAGGIAGPLLFGHLINSGNPDTLAVGFYIGAVVMAIGGVAELLFGVKAEQQPLESIAKPLTAEEAESGRLEPGAEEPAAAEAEIDTRPEIQHARQNRQAAEYERARAAQHRARAHELRSAALEGGQEDGSQQAEIEEVLADLADLNAEAEDELAVANEQRAEAAGADADSTEREAAEERARAADERALTIRQRAEAIAAERDGDARAHEAIARAAEERAQAAEQRALAAEREARAGEFAEEERTAEAAARARGEREERERRAREFEQRVRARLARQERSRQGIRRFRPGPGRAMYSPLLSSRSPFDESADLDREIDAIGRALHERGEMTREELRQAVGARYWGPGRFRGALREAVGEGAARRVGRSSYASGDSGDEAGD
jgi:MFS family permease